MTAKRNWMLYDKRIEQKYDRFRKMYPEIRGKKVDFVKHWMEEGILFFSIRFMDGTNFGVQYEPTAELVGVEYSDMKTWRYGDSERVFPKA